MVGEEKSYKALVQRFSSFRTNAMSEKSAGYFVHKLIGSTDFSLRYAPFEMMKKTRLRSINLIGLAMKIKK